MRVKTKTSVTIWNCPNVSVFVADACKQQFTRIYESIPKPVLGRNEMSTSTCSGLLHPPNHLVYRIAVCVRTAIQLGGSGLEVSEIWKTALDFTYLTNVRTCSNADISTWFFVGFSNPNFGPCCTLMDQSVTCTLSPYILRGKRRRATSM